MPIVLVHPVGAQEVQPAEDGDLGPLPDPEPSDTRGGQPFARRWGEACLEELGKLDPKTQAAVVRRHLRVPMLKKVLDSQFHEQKNEPSRIVLVVSDQRGLRSGDGARHPGYWNDTLFFGRLIEHWLLAKRPGISVETVVLERDPHDFKQVMATLAPQVAAIARDCDQVLVTQAGGTPAMSFASLLAFALSDLPHQVRHVHVEQGGTVTAQNLPVMLSRARVLESARELLARREPAAAAVVLEAIEGQPGIGPVTNLCGLAAALRGRDLEPLTRPALVELLAYEPARLEQLDELRRQPAESAKLRLAGHEAIWAERVGNLALFLNLLAALYEHLPTQWFIANERADSAVGAAEVFPRFDWHGFPDCQLSRHSGRDVRRRFVKAVGKERGGVPRGLFQELFRCRASPPPGGAHGRPTCNCGLRAAPLSPDLALALGPAVFSWRSFDRGALRDLRHLTFYSHGLSALDRDAVQAAVHGWGGGGGLAEKLAGEYEQFGLVLGDDLVGALCEDARGLLASVR